MNEHFCKKHALAHAGPTCPMCDRDATIAAQAARIAKLEAENVEQANYIAWCNPRIEKLEEALGACLIELEMQLCMKSNCSYDEIRKYNRHVIAARAALEAK